MPVRPGDTVRTLDGRELVVVDVSGDGWAVLRERDDLSEMDLTATPATELTVTGQI
ncbi:MAG TPA: hypothetical protein VHI11_11550 [Jiangellaceae bacterium]|jgi:hypothetical protein|nr:hypothetical protein [Jiangellaceae bacterium]